MSENAGKVNLTQSKFTWVIKDFERKARIYDNIRSPHFITIIDGAKTRWTINMTLDETGQDGKEYIGIFLESHSHNGYFEFDVEFAILNLFDKEVYKTKFRCFCEIQTGLSEFIKKEKLFKGLPLVLNKVLTVICTITTNQYVVVERQKDSDEKIKLLRLEESDNLLQLFHKQTFSDVTFSVEGKQIHAHKSIIVNRSPVFEAMFKHDMKETKDNTVIVTDMSYTAMFDLLKFIYSGKVPSYITPKFESYKNLMTASDKYGIENLKRECERRLICSLDVDNVFESLNLADTYNILQLKESAIEFIADHGDEIIDSPAYKDFGKLHPDISCEVFRALVIKKRKYD